MIEKMKFLSLTAPKTEFDRVVDSYLSKYEIHLENALSELRSVKDLRPFVETNPYREEWKLANDLVQNLPAQSTPVRELSLEEAVDAVRSIRQTLAQLNDREAELEKQLETYTASYEQVAPFTQLNYDISSILHFRCIKFRFGRISLEYFEKFQSFVYDAVDTILFKCREDEEYVWLVYFTPAPCADKVDAIYASMHFERLFLPDDYEGTPKEAAQLLEEKIAGIKADLESIRKERQSVLESRREELTGAAERLNRYTRNFDVRKLAACTNHDDNTFFILCGWMTARDAAAFQKESESDKDLFLILEPDHNDILSKPPTKMRNPGIFRPFEMFIQMYGLPDYNEIDPTILVAITYSVFFGFMFGDMGQGLCLLIGGFLLYRAKKMNLAAIISCCGFFSTIFGFLFGSIFGFEDIIDAAWLRPGEAMTTLPFIGRLNTVFVIAVALGMGIIILTMILNIINSIRAHDPEKTWFDTNGAAGLVFYAAMASVIVLFMTGHPLPAGIVLAVMFGIPLLLMFFKEPLTALVEKKAAAIEGGKGMFVVQGFFELFEVLLSYFSNTISFVRVGAFAVSHAAMMEVVLMLAGYESGSASSVNWLVVVLGNVFVCGMEGLIVGIQVLRLEYYELFSRFYRGTGRAFKPYGRSSKAN
ncbi:MAG TPA: ATPase [Candidatus Caccovicinus merdipullorum]|uniref:ATPase n=1 Tax=Candidatus Caccovicinus merdipullorum TaxID=2840724 RepID=A0A9D1GH47_9FIRM|nr:ATPase [Candidatus Caccovicinus merdipullorum]